MPINFDGVKNAVLFDMRGIGARFVYILRSDSDPARHYVGRTANVDERLGWHNAGPCGYTVHHRPWSVIVSLEFPGHPSVGDCAIRFTRSYSLDGSTTVLARFDISLVPL